MTQFNEGLPPGVQLGRSPGPEQQAAAQKRRQNAQMTTVNELASRLPGGLQGTPVLFNDGIPQIEDEPVAALTPAEQAALAGQQVPAHEIAAQVQQQAQRAAPQHVPQQPTQSAEVTNRVVSQKAREAHPVLQRLRKSFGLNKERRYPLDIFDNDGNKFTYMMAPCNDRLGVFVITESQKEVQKEGEAAGTSWFRLLSACAAVLAIDGVPIHEVYGLVTTPAEDKELAKDRYDIPLRLRKEAALILAHELFENTDTNVGDKLDTFYQNKILNENKTVSSYDREFEGAFRYVCPLDGCRDVHLSKPQLAENGDELSFHCRYHGLALIKTASLSAEVNVPLA